MASSTVQSGMAESSANLNLKYLEPERAWLILSFEHALFEPPAQD